MTLYKIPLVLTRQPEGGYTVTSPAIPELVTEGDTPNEVVEHVSDAIQAVFELYEDLGRSLPHDLRKISDHDSISFEHLIATP